MTEIQVKQTGRPAQTEFLRLTIARAVTPRMHQRAQALTEMERLLMVWWRGGQLGVRGHLLGSLHSRYPVSHRAIEMELRGFGPQGLVEAAEQIELRFWTRGYSRRPVRISGGPWLEPFRDGDGEPEA